MGDLRQTFYTLTDFLEHVTGPTVNDKSYLGREYDSYAEWFGVEAETRGREYAGQTVLRLSRDGWPNGAKLLESVVASQDTPRAQNIRRRAVWQNDGDDIDMQRVYVGNLDKAWRGMTRRSGYGPQRVRIVVDSIASAGLRSEKMRWRGVAAMRLADALVSAGYSVQVESAFRGNGGPEANIGRGERVLRVVVKPYTAPLDMEALAATCALPGFFRALGHAWSGGGMSVPHLQLSDIADPTDAASVFIIPQSVSDAETASREVDRVLLELQPSLEIEAVV